MLYRVASLWVDAAQAGRTSGFAAQEIETMKTAAGAVQARVGEGYELPIEGKRAELNVARATERATNATADQEYAESSLAMVLGFPDSDRVRAVQQDDIGPNVKQVLPENEDVAVKQALHNSRELRLLESRFQAANFAVKEQKTQRLPQVDLVAQYALFARYNYKDFFPASSFRRNNAELGIAVRLPLLIGSAVSGAMSQAEVDMAKARIQTNNTRSRIAVETRRSYGDLKKADDARAVARLDLDVARDQLSVLLAAARRGPRERTAGERGAIQRTGEVDCVLSGIVCGGARAPEPAEADRNFIGRSQPVASQGGRPLETDGLPHREAERGSASDSAAAGGADAPTANRPRPARTKEPGSGTGSAPQMGPLAFTFSTNVVAPVATFNVSSWPRKALNTYTVPFT